MGLNKMFRGLFVMVAIYTLLSPKHQHVFGAPSSAVVDGVHRARNRPMVRLLPRVTNQYAKLKPDFTEFFFDDDDLYEFSKRQASDDYGHLRFGKRGDEQFDDYGHMRFGRSNTD